MKITANLNDYILVRLTDAGERAWEKYWKVTHCNGVPGAVRDAATLPDGRVRFQLWTAMHIFGSVCHLGIGTSPFVANEVEIRQG